MTNPFIDMTAHKNTHISLHLVASIYTELLSSATWALRWILYLLPNQRPAVYHQWSSIFNMLIGPLGVFIYFVLANATRIASLQLPTRIPNSTKFHRDNLIFHQITRHRHIMSTICFATELSFKDKIAHNLSLPKSVSINAYRLKAHSAPFKKWSKIEQVRQHSTTHTGRSAKIQPIQSYTATHIII